MIRVENIVKTYWTDDGQSTALQVLRGISLEIQRGEIIAVVGVSGAGKSTLLHILGTLDRPTSGRVLYDNEDVFTYSDERIAQFRNQHVGFVFQFHHLLPEFTVLENVCMPALIQGMKLSDVRATALKLLGDVGVEAKSSSKPSKLSGGEQQRVAVARALMNSPELVLADEPSGNLDTTNAQQLHDLIRNLSRDRGQTFVIVTHNEAFAQKADRIVKIVDGVIAENYFYEKS
jgi:lipoprotein-releasing system ATP-binding protein